jgi:hypothetical protein
MHVDLLGSTSAGKATLAKKVKAGHFLFLAFAILMLQAFLKTIAPVL